MLNSDERDVVTLAKTPEGEARGGPDDGKAAIAWVNVAADGVATSAHCSGRAADFICPGFGTPLQVCTAITQSDIRFDQLIHEFSA